MTPSDHPHRPPAGRLPLLQPQRQLTPREFNALSFAERLEVLRLAQGRQRYDLILAALDAELLVRRLPAQELYLLIKELGGEDVPELIALTSTEQFTLFLDLDCWERDQLREEAALRWLALLLEAGEEKAVRTALEMEFELLVLMVKRFVTITGAPGDLLDEDALMERRLAGVYDLDYRDEGSAKVLGGFLDLIFRHDRDFYLRLMEAVRREDGISLEEEAYGFHRGRLLDHGFPDPAEARSVYAWLDPDTFDPTEHRKVASRVGEEGTEAPSFVLAAARPKDLLAEVLAGGLSSEICWELTFLLNKVMSADRVDVGDLDQVRSSTGEVYHYLNLGLEHLSGSDTGAASALLADCYLEHLFRLGFSLTRQLQRQAAGISDSLIGPWLDGPFRSFLRALLQPKPRFYQGIEEETRAGERPFANLHDLVLAGEWLTRLEILRRLFEERLPLDLPDQAGMNLAGCIPDDPGDLTLSTIFLTALANRVLGRAFVPRPLPREELAPLHGRVCREGRVDPELRRETRQWLDALEPGAAAFGDWCLDRWEEEFCRQSAEALDPRYLSGLIVRVAPSP